MNVPLWIVCTLFGLVGVLLLVGSTRALWLGYRATSWPHTTATLLASEFKTYESAGEDPVTTWEVLVRYEYWVAGQRYEGTRIHPAYSASNSWRMHDLLSQRLQPSRRVRVYYHADRPTESTLAVGFFSRPLAIGFAGLLFLVLGVGIPLSAYSVLSPELTLLAIGAGVLPAFYFAFAGRDSFVRGIRLVAAKPGRRKR